MEHLQLQSADLGTEDKILLLPGNDVTVDVSRNELGLAPLLL